MRRHQQSRQGSYPWRSRFDSGAVATNTAAQWSVNRTGAPGRLAKPIGPQGLGIVSSTLRAAPFGWFAGGPAPRFESGYASESSGDRHLNHPLRLRAAAPAAIL